MGGLRIATGTLCWALRSVQRGVSQIAFGVADSTANTTLGVMDCGLDCEMNIYTGDVVNLLGAVFSDDFLPDLLLALAHKLCLQPLVTTFVHNFTPAEHLSTPASWRHHTPRQPFASPKYHTDGPFAGFYPTTQAPKHHGITAPCSRLLHRQ